MCACMYKFKRVHACAHECVCAYAYLPACMCVCVCACMSKSSGKFHFSNLINLVHIVSYCFFNWRPVGCMYVNICLDSSFASKVVVY